MRTITALQTTKYYNSLITHNMETLRLLSTTQQVDPALFGEEYSDYIDVTEESPFKDYTTLFLKPIATLKCSVPFLLIRFSWL